MKKTGVNLGVTEPKAAKAAKTRIRSGPMGILSPKDEPAKKAPKKPWNMRIPTELWEYLNTQVREDLPPSVISERMVRFMRDFDAELGALSDEIGRMAREKRTTPGVIVGILVRECLKSQK